MTTMTTYIEPNLDVFSSFIQDNHLEYKDYQYNGVKWCLTNELRPDPPQNIRGGFIADEMGLGKTITMIGTMVSNPLPSTLIVVPPILIQQWSDHISRTMNDKPLVFHGPIKKKITINILSSYSMVITTYGAIAINANIQGTLLHQHKWNRIIFDESHHMRNKKTRLHISAQLLKADIRWLVSGTPVQNSIKDFYSLCSLIKLPRSFYTDKLNLNQIAKSFILKRTKKQVGIDISDLHLQELSVPWTNNYEKNLSKEIHACLGFTDCDELNRLSESFIGSNKIVHMIRAKQSCIMSQLISPKTLKYKNKQSLHHSSKADFIVEFINKRKHFLTGKIIFCNYKQEIDLFYNRFTQIGLSVAFIDGRINKQQRNIILSKPYDVLILQIQTGCEGLNLQQYYSEIYFVSPHWNPAVEDQAIARCHRLGQHNTVYVFRFQMETFDDTHDTSNIETYTTSTQQNKRIKVSEIIS